MEINFLEGNANKLSNNGQYNSEVKRLSQDSSNLTFCLNTARHKLLYAFLLVSWRLMSLLLSWLFSTEIKRMRIVSIHSQDTCHRHIHLYEFKSSLVLLFLCARLPCLSWWSPSCWWVLDHCLLLSAPEYPSRQHR